MDSRWEERRLKMPKVSRILIVEDEPELAEALKTNIISWGYKALGADSARTAHEKMRNEKFGIIILDLNLKEKSGLSVIEGLRGNTHALNRTTPIFIHSGFINKSIVGTHSTQISEFFVKPVKMPSLKEKIEKWLGESHEAS